MRTSSVNGAVRCDAVRANAGQRSWEAGAGTETSLAHCAHRRQAALKRLTHGSLVDCGAIQRLAGVVCVRLVLESDKPKASRPSRLRDRGNPARVPEAHGVKSCCLLVGQPVCVCACIFTALVPARASASLAR